MAAEEKDEAAREEDRFKFDLFTRRPDLYNEIYGEAARARIEEEAEVLVPQNEAEVEELLAAMRELEASATKGR